MTPDGELTELYRTRLAGATSGLLARILAAWLTVWDADAPIVSLVRLSAVAAVWTQGAQRFAADESARYLAASVAIRWRLAAADVEPFAIPAGLVGISAAGRPLADMMGLAPAVYWARITAGYERGDAARAAAEWLGRVAGSEPYRVANRVTLHNARADRRLTGRMRRISRPGSCAFCTALAERGYSPAAAGFPAHGHCRCTASPEIGSRP